MGIRDPWTQYDGYCMGGQYVPKTHCIFVAGDDKYSAIPRDLAQLYANTFYSMTSRSKGESSHLGIIIKQIKVFDDICSGFLSKWMFRSGDKVVAFRDLSKALCIKMYYTRDLKVFHANPLLIL